MTKGEDGMRLFDRYIGIDYSGAKTPEASLPGLRAYMATDDSTPCEVSPPPSPRKYWTRRGLAEWLAAILKESPRTIVGIDHGFSFPIAYFEKYKLERDWDNFLSDFCAHWPTHAANTYVDFVRDGTCGRGANRQGNSKWRRLAEIRAPHTHSVFHFDAQGSVAKSTHSGLPWLRYLRRELGPSIHFWPFDGWMPRNGSHVVVEVYPSLWRNLYSLEDRTGDQQDAYAACRWLQETDRADNLTWYFNPLLTPDEQAVASIEGWILGVGPIR
jgi:hypothetical protein